jgi:hypothetical protein
VIDARLNTRTLLESFWKSCGCRVWYVLCIARVAKRVAHTVNIRSVVGTMMPRTFFGRPKADLQRCRTIRPRGREITSRYRQSSANKVRILFSPSLRPCVSLSFLAASPFYLCLSSCHQFPSLCYPITSMHELAHLRRMCMSFVSNGSKLVSR